MSSMQIAASSEHPAKMTKVAQPEPMIGPSVINMPTIRAIIAPWAMTTAPSLPHGA
jgi:hypothetical protein